MEASDQCRLCSCTFKKRKGQGGYDKKNLAGKLRAFDISVHAAMDLIYWYKGPEEGHICGKCFLKLERAYKAYTEIEASPRPLQGGFTATHPQKRKDHTPGKTPRILKKKKAAPLTPTFIHSPSRASTPKIAKRLHYSSKSASSKKSPPKSKRGNLIPIQNALAKSQYYTALQHILSRGAAAEKAFNAILNKKIRKEIKGYQKNNKFPVLENTQSINNFSWLDIIINQQQIMPTLLTALHATMPSADKFSADKFRTLIIPRIGFMMTIPLYTLNPRKFNFFQALSGVQMWRCGASEKLFKCFNHLGICQSVETARRRVDKFCEESDLEMLAWKQSLEITGQGRPSISSDYIPSEGFLGREATVSASDLDQSASVNISLPSMSGFATGLSLSNEEDWVDMSDEDDEEYLPLADEESITDGILHMSVADDFEDTWNESSFEEDSSDDKSGCGFALVWDNTQKQVQARDQSREHSNKMLLWANAYAAKNRIDPKFLDDNDLCLNAAQIPMASYFKNNEDELMLQHRMKTLVSRILVQHMPHFQQCYQDVVEWHIPHAHDEASRHKSQLVNIGIIDENPSSTAGTIAIMEILQKFVPRRKDGSYRVVPTHGDALSVERMTDGKRARAADLSDVDRLEGLEAVPQEFHHRGLMLQETMNILFNGKSLTDRGTLAQLKNAFGHRNVTTDVMNSFNYVDNFIRFVTEAYVVYLAMKICEMEKISDVPQNSCPHDISERRKHFLQNICEKVVEEVWLLTPMTDICEVLEAEIESGSTNEDWCTCGEDRDEEMVRCSNPDCPIGAWFHISCIGLDIKRIPGPRDDWWCCQDCKDTGASSLCKCKKIKNGPTAICANGDECKNGICFHLGCVNLNAIPGENWYCSSNCKLDGDSEDYVRNYSLAITWYGLLDLSHRDIIREADGLAMMSMWRINIPRFWRGNHYKYMIIAHRLLAGINGWLNPRLIEEIIHNRTVNLKGGKGRNIAMDRVCEFLNDEFKATLKHAHGSYTDRTVKRAGKIVGSLGRALDGLFHEKIAEVVEEETYRKKKNYQADIEAFIEEYKEDQLFHHIPGRHHHSFPLFSCDMGIKKPEKLKARLQKYTRKLDRTRAVLL